MPASMGGTRVIREIEIEPSWKLGDYDTLSHLADAVRALRLEASMLVPTLRGRTVWMVNSTPKGGGVAEMLPRVVALLGELGVPTRWAVIGSNRQEFFRLTKAVHNLIHGEGEATLGNEDRELYEKVNAENARWLKPMVRPEDILVVHDPQPAAFGTILKRELGLRTVWRCHIGLDEHTAATRRAWKFLKPYVETYDLAVFSAPEYIPDFLAGRSTIIHPALDPANHKNRDLPPHKLTGILCNAGLKLERHPVITPPFSRQALRLMPDGSFAPAVNHEEIGLLYRPIVSQISRWDRLKGYRPLLEGFVRLKSTLSDGTRESGTRHYRCLELMRLVLAGADPHSVQDDPEAREVLDELAGVYMELNAEIQKDVVLLSLPMESRKENALMVNGLQRCSTLVVQNSLREGFGLTATEAMWKGVPIMGTRAYGLRQQIRSGIDGTLVQDPSDPEEIARRLDDILEDVPKREQMARAAQQRVHDEFLIFTQLCKWLRALSKCASSPARTNGGEPDGE
jgi:trehalose synthase